MGEKILIGAGVVFFVLMGTSIVFAVLGAVGAIRLETARAE